jgi:hypothetical protein
LTGIQKNSTAKVILGSGPQVHADWLSTDVNVMNSSAVILDVAKKFPFEDEAIDYYFIETCK